MSKRAIEAAKRAFPFRAATAKLYDGQTVTFDGNEAKREIFQQGYEQAGKDTIERACEYLFKYYAVNLDEFRKAMEEE